MIKNNKLLLITSIIFILIIMIMPTYSMATSSENPIDNPSFYEPTINPSDSSQAVFKANGILSTITVIGIVTSVITLTILGIKYMLGSLEEKAEYKKSMLPYIIGVVFLIATSTIVGIIAKATEGAIK